MYRQSFATKKVALSALGALEPGISISAEDARAFDVSEDRGVVRAQPVIADYDAMPRVLHWSLSRLRLVQAVTQSTLSRSVA
jgi:hypothetical protein